MGQREVAGQARGAAPPSAKPSTARGVVGRVVLAHDGFSRIGLNDWVLSSVDTQVYECLWPRRQSSSGRTALAIFTATCSKESSPVLRPDRDASNGLSSRSSS